MKEIPLTNSDKKAVVDDDDFERVSQHHWYLNNAGYPYTSIKQQDTALHQFIMGKRPGQETDHIDGNRLNCRKDNLRFCNHSQNIANDGPRTNNKLGVKGVDFYNGRYRATIRKDYKKIYIGSFNSLKEAAIAWNEASKNYFGEFAYQNSIEVL